MNTIELDLVTPTLKKIAKIDKGFGNQALNKAGAEILKAMQKKARRMGTHKGRWASYKGKRAIDMNKTKKNYSRESMATGRDLSVDMADLIRFRLYEHSSVLLAGWINTKSFTSLRYKGGIAHKFKRVKGTKTKAIAKKMAEGGRTSIEEEARLSGISVREQISIYKRSGMGGVVKRGYVMRKARPIMRFGQYKVIAERVAQQEFKQAIKEFRKVA